MLARSGCGGHQDRAARRRGDAVLSAVCRRQERRIRDAQRAAKRARAIDLKNRGGAREVVTLLIARRRARRAVSSRRDGAAGTWLRERARDQSAPHLLLDLGLRPDRTARAGSRARSQLHRHTGLLALQPGAAAPTVPPALIADIAGGSFPAVINILLALRQRDATGEGCHLDIAMADAMFTFAWHALATGAATGKLSGAGRGSAGRRIAALPTLSTRDGKLDRLRGAGAEILAWLSATRSG